jgi:hypothetical protein
MEISGQLHAPAALSPGKKTPVPSEYEIGWALEPILDKRQISCTFYESNHDSSVELDVLVPNKKAKKNKYAHTEKK